MLLPISPVGIRRTAVEDILETSHHTELTETAVTSEVVVALLVGLFLNIAGVKERNCEKLLEMRKLTDMDAQDNILHRIKKRGEEKKFS